MMWELREAVPRIAALFSYCGGPLFIADQLKPHFDSVAVFLVTFLPVGLMVIGAFFLDGLSGTGSSSQASGRAARASTSSWACTHMLSAGS